MAPFRTLIWRAVGRSTQLSRALRRMAPNPFRFIEGKPLERWLLTYDLGRRSLALGNDPAVVEAVMQDRAGTFPKSAALCALLRPMIGTGVFGQPGGPEVRETRKLYSRALAAIPDEVVVEITRTVADRYFRRWLRSGTLERLPLCTELSRMTVDIVALCTLGATFDPAESERFAELFFEYHQRAVPLLLLPAPDDPRIHARIVGHMELEPIGSAMRTLIRDRFVTPLVTGDSTALAAPFAVQLHEAGLLGTATDDAERAVDEIAVMLLAGHETTASVLSWLFWELARSPERQAALALLLPPGGVSGEQPPAETTEPAKSTEADEAVRALVKEALRLYPPIAFFLRDACKPTTFRGKPIPKGSLFVVSPWSLHRHRKLWQAPDEFRPERWQGQGPGCPRAAYIPFGMGPRTCPGAHFAEIETQQIVRLLLERFRFKPSMSAQPKPLGSLTSRPDREIYLSLKPRVSDTTEEDAPRCPITGEAPRRRIQFLRRSLLRSLWRVGTGIDVARLFPGHTPLGLYESNDGLLFFHPAVEGDARFYSEFYSRVDMHEHLMRELLDRVEYRRAARHVRPGDRVLDIGCGVGAFRAHVPDARFLGLDPFAPTDADSLVLREDAVQHCREHPATYDVVTAFQVIEHLAQPRQLVESMLQALRPGGLLILCAPLHPSPMTALPNFLLNAPPHHLSWWNRPAFAALADRCGLEIIELAELDASPHEGMIHWMERFCPSKTAHDRDGRYFVHRWDWHLSVGLAWGLAHLAHRIRALPPRSRPVAVLLVARKPG